MNSPLLSAGLDLLVASLLVAVIVYAIRLNRMLAGMRAGKEELAATITRFDAAAAHAERAVAAMGAAAAEAGKGLDSAIAEATALRDELVFLAERGDGIAARLAGTPSPKAPPAAAPTPPAKPRPRPTVVADVAEHPAHAAARPARPEWAKPAAPLTEVSVAERELLHAMQKARAAS